MSANSGVEEEGGSALPLLESQKCWKTSRPTCAGNLQDPSPHRQGAAACSPVPAAIHPPEPSVSYQLTPPQLQYAGTSFRTHHSARISQVGYNCSGGSVFEENSAFLTNELWQESCHSPRVQSHRAAGPQLQLHKQSLEPCRAPVLGLESCSIKLSPSSGCSTRVPSLTHKECTSASLQRPVLLLSVRVIPAWNQKCFKTIFTVSSANSSLLAPLS